jgi:hypothetical protein
MAWPTDEIQADPSLGLALCRLAMGLDVLYRSARAHAGGEAALASEGLVPVDLWRGEPLPLHDWSAAAEAVAALEVQAPHVQDPVRRTFLEDTLRSLATFVDWQRGNDGLTFRDRAERLLGLVIEPIALDAWRADLQRAVGPDVVGWEHSHTLEPEDLPRLFAQIGAEARGRALEVVGEVPPRPLMRLELVHDVPYTGYCDYASNTMRLNADQPFTAERLKLLVLHEAYPGHDYHLWRREHEVRAGAQPLDSLLVITNTPSSPLFEGIGDNGALFLDWLDHNERLHFDLGKLRSAACVNACLMLHEQELSAERVRAYLIEEGYAEPTWANTRLRFMQDALRAPFVFSYYLGYRTVADAAATWRGSRHDFYTALYGRMHSPRSLQLAAERSSRSL